ncbi:MAG: hypothetical protein VXW17_02260 [Pseudomonadota bacterium]|nr:hypothetical protein [Pseudomonadota bacterium]MEC7236822.1 hypothetical protein [Pseudomonadota bacterium]
MNRPPSRIKTYRSTSHAFCEHILPAVPTGDTAGRMDAEVDEIITNGPGALL